MRTVLFHGGFEKHKLCRKGWDLAFCEIPFSGFIKVENVSSNQRSERPPCFSDRPVKHRLGNGR